MLTSVSSLPAQPVTVPLPTNLAQKSSIVGPVVGGVVGGLGLIALALLALFFWRRRQRARASESTAKLYDIDEVDSQFQPTPNPAIALYSLPADHSTSRDHLDPEGRQSHDVYPSPVPMTTVTSPARLTKAQEAARRRHQPSGYTTTTSDMMSSAPHSNPASNSGSSDREAPSVVSPSEVQGLRTEVENLRRAMDEMQMERIEAPPSYTPQQ